MPAQGSPSAASTSSALSQRNGTGSLAAASSSYGSFTSSREESGVGVMDGASAPGSGASASSPSQELVSSAASSARRGRVTAAMKSPSSAEPTQPSSSSPPASTSPSPPHLLTTVEEEVEIIGFGRFHAVALAILGLANAADAIELLCMSFILPQLTEFGDTDRSVLSSAIFIGMLVGGLVFGIASDAAGRKTALVTALVINATFGALSAAVPPYGELIACRVAAGFGVGGSIPGVFTLCVEFLPIKGRGFYLSTVAAWWMVGSIYAAGAAWLMIGYLGLSWRIFALACAAPVFVAALGVAFFLPESPRYLQLRGDPDAAESVLMRISSWNRADTRLKKGYRLARTKEEEREADAKMLRGNTGLENEEAMGAGVVDGSGAEEKDGASYQQRGFSATSSEGVPSTPVSSSSAGGKGFATQQRDARESLAVFAIGNDDGDDGEPDKSLRDPQSVAVAMEKDKSGTGGSGGGGGGSNNDRGAEEEGDELSASLAAARAERSALLDTSNGGPAAASTASASSSSSSSRLCCGRSTRGARRRRGPSVCSRAFCSDAMQPVREFFAPPLARTSILLMLVWLCLSLGWYGLTLWIPTIFHESNVDLDEYQDAFLVQASNLPGNILSALLMDRIGRKKVLALSLVVAGAAAVAFPFGKTEVAVVASACVLNAASTCTWNALDCLSTESFPTSLRTTAMGLLAASGRIGSIMGQFVFGALIHVSLFALLGVAGGVLALGAVAGLLLPKEPSGQRLAESVKKQR